MEAPVTTEQDRDLLWAVDDSKMDKIGSTNALDFPKQSDWECYLWGNKPNSGYGMVYTPQEGQVPNRFVRWMMTVCFACTWVRKEVKNER